jgi:hypothetical protein
MVLSIRLDRADRIARERRKAKQFWPTPGVSLTSARACMAGCLCPPTYPKAQAGCSAAVRLVRSAVRTERPAGRSAHGSSKGSGAGPSPPVPPAPRKRSSIWWASLAGVAQHRAQSRKRAFRKRVMRCDGYVSWEKKNLSVRSTRKVDYEKYSPRLYPYAWLRPRSDG